jgi:ParB-like chromosome segregation protein Spo0J
MSVTDGASGVRPELDALVVPIGSVQPHPDNPRKGDVGRLVESLEVHGQYRPIVVQRASGFVIAGNHTLAAARRLGWASIAATFVDCDDATARKIMVADNRYADLGTYDRDALLDLLTGFDELDGVGWTQDELAALVARPPAGSRNQGERQDEFPEGERPGEFACPNCGHEWSGNPRAGA